VEENTGTPPRAPQPGPTCPNCKTAAKFFTSVFDMKSDRTIQIYKCERCRDEVWQ